MNYHTLYKLNSKNTQQSYSTLRQVKSKLDVNLGEKMISED